MCQIAEFSTGQEWYIFYGQLGKNGSWPARVFHLVTVICHIIARDFGRPSLTYPANRQKCGRNMNMALLMPAYLFCLIDRQKCTPPTPPHFFSQSDTNLSPIGASCLLCPAHRRKCTCPCFLSSGKSVRLPFSCPFPLVVHHRKVTLICYHLEHFACFAQSTGENVPASVPTCNRVGPLSAFSHPPDQRFERG